MAGASFILCFFLAVVVGVVLAVDVGAARFCLPLATKTESSWSAGWSKCAGGATLSHSESELSDPGDGASTPSGSLVVVVIIFLRVVVVE